MVSSSSHHDDYGDRNADPEGVDDHEAEEAEDGKQVAIAETRRRKTDLKKQEILARLFRRNALCEKHL